MKLTMLRPLSFESFPDYIGDGVLYVSMIFTIAVHWIACGCGQEVLTLLSPTDWQPCFDR